MNAVAGHPRRLAVVSAMRPELAALLPHVQGLQVHEVAGRRLHLGRLVPSVAGLPGLKGAQDEADRPGCEAVLVLCGIGKVAAALTTTLLIERLGVQALLFTGVAGGLGHGVRVGDVVVARELLQHDLDCSPLFPRHQVPDLGRDRLPCDAVLSDALRDAAREVLQRPPEAMAAFGVGSAALHEGLVISGDRFVATSAEGAALRERLPQALAVEMEGAAMAQVCAAYGVPCAMVRTVSDRADDQAHVDFPRFLEQVASPMSRDIVLGAVQRWAAGDAAVGSGGRT